MNEKTIHFRIKYGYPQYWTSYIPVLSIVYSSIKYRIFQYGTQPVSMIQTPPSSTATPSLQLITLITLHTFINHPAAHYADHHKNKYRDPHTEIISFDTWPYLEYVFRLITKITNHGTTFHHTTVRILDTVYLNTILRVWWWLSSVSCWWRDRALRK